MLTAFHRDGKHLVLSHYCVAGNQPLLEAFDPGPDTVTFRYRGGTNLASRENGHMDSVVFTLSEPDRYSSRWTWYQDGVERWMEEISYERDDAAREGAR